MPKRRIVANGHPAALLSAQLRAQTACPHEQTEGLLGLPDAIQTLRQYRGWLCQVLGLYAPLEQLLAGFSEWNNHGLALPSPSHGDCVAADLAVPGIDPAGVSHTHPTLLPCLPTFAHALGALYVLEGSTLGGQVILRDIEARIGPQIAGATRFFGGRGAAAGQTWQTFKTALDAFGRESPNLRAAPTSRTATAALTGDHHLSRDDLRLHRGCQLFRLCQTKPKAGQTCLPIAFDAFNLKLRRFPGIRLGHQLDPPCQFRHHPDLAP